MTYPTAARSGEIIEHIPQPRHLVRKLMLATAMASDGFADQHPEEREPFLRNCILVPQANLVIAGTGCRRPLLLEEFSIVCEVTGREGVIVRLKDDPERPAATFDVKALGSTEMYCRYLLWMGTLYGPAWLIPTAGERVYVRFDPDGMDFGIIPPFLDDADRDRGISNGNQFLQVAMRGWF